MMIDDCPQLSCPPEEGNQGSGGGGRKGGKWIHAKICKFTKIRLEKVVYSKGILFRHAHLALSLRKIFCWKVQHELEKVFC